MSFLGCGHLSDHLTALEMRVSQAHGSRGDMADSDLQIFVQNLLEMGGGSGLSY